MNRKDPYRDRRAVSPVVVSSTSTATITHDGGATIEDGDHLNAARSGSRATGGEPTWTAGSRVTAGTAVTGTDAGGTWNGETIRVVGNSGEGDAAPLVRSTASQ